MSFTLHKTPRRMAHSLRVLAALLSYPDASLRPHLAEMRALLQSEGALGAPRIAEISALIARLAQADPIDSEAGYVELFDRGRSTSLHLFEHVHGDSRERGPALIDLGKTYAQSGLMLVEGELPDYLPAAVEFASTLEPAQARAFLGEMAHILNRIFGALQERDAGYASLLAALLELAGEKVQPAAPSTAPAEALDESWAEPPAFDGCTSAAGRARAGQPQPIQVIRRNAHPGAHA